MNDSLRFSTNVAATTRRAVLALALGAVTALGCSSPDAEFGAGSDSVQGSLQSTATEVFDWNTFASDLVAANQPSPIQTHSLAIVQIAVHDALNAIQPKYERYEYSGSAPGASVAAAVAAAAHDALVQVLPPAAAAIDAKYQARLAAIPGGAAKDAGVAAGQASAAAILALRGGDDLFGALGKPYTPGPATPGVYQLTPPLNVVVLAGWGDLPTFALDGGSQFRSPPPFALNSRAYTKDYNEVKSFGSAASTTRTAEQTQTAQFWYDAATREWHRAARKGLADVGADEWKAARTLALVSIAMADGVIASAETKFNYNYWRPITAIRAGDADGNASTQGDAAWEPLCVTPPFPEYNSTHAVTGAAAAGVLALTVGDGHTFTVDSPTLPGVTRTYNRFSAAAYEEGISRIYCGIHFRNGMNTGLAQGGIVAGFVRANLLRQLLER